MDFPQNIDHRSNVEVRRNELYGKIFALIGKFGHGAANTEDAENLVSLMAEFLLVGGTTPQDPDARYAYQVAGMKFDRNGGKETFFSRVETKKAELIAASNREMISAITGK